MDTDPAEMNARLAARLRRLRTERDLTLDGLAARAGVSRSAISLVERGESSPTAALLGRLAAGLGVSLASLFAADERANAAPLARRADQPTWRDPASGYLRRNLSPPGFPSPIELVEVLLPAGARVAYDTAWTARAADIGEQVWVLDGRIELTVGEVIHALDAGDCLALRLDRPTAFRNPTDRLARYLVALASEATPGSPRHARTPPSDQRSAP